MLVTAGVISQSYHIYGNMHVDNSAALMLYPADLNLRSMQLWQQQHPDLCHFCGCLMLHDERPTDHDPAYPNQHIPAGKELTYGYIYSLL